ncbi:MAG: hypothetical protein IPH54_20440 [Rhodoferax sp.]|nr:hypothetical protein [Rhodoferax sp.]
MTPDTRSDDDDMPAEFDFSKGVDYNTFVNDLPGQPARPSPRRPVPPFGVRPL